MTPCRGVAAKIHGTNTSRTGGCGDARWQRAMCCSPWDRRSGGKHKADSGHQPVQAGRVQPCQRSRHRICPNIPSAKTPRRLPQSSLPHPRECLARGVHAQGHGLARGPRNGRCTAGRTTARVTSHRCGGVDFIASPRLSFCHGCCSVPRPGTLHSATTRELSTEEGRYDFHHPQTDVGG